jgi:hypothetical protein
MLWLRKLSVLTVAGVALCALASAQPQHQTEQAEAQLLVPDLKVIVAEHCEAEIQRLSQDPNADPVDQTVFIQGVIDDGYQAHAITGGRADATSWLGDLVKQLICQYLEEHHPESRLYIEWCVDWVPLMSGNVYVTIWIRDIGGGMNYVKVRLTPILQQAEPAEAEPVTVIPPESEPCTSGGGGAEPGMPDVDLFELVARQTIEEQLQKPGGLDLIQLAAFAAMKEHFEKDGTITVTEWAELSSVMEALGAVPLGTGTTMMAGWDWWDNFKDKLRCLYDCLTDFLRQFPKVKVKIHLGPKGGIEWIEIEGEVPGAAVADFLDCVFNCLFSSSTSKAVPFGDWHHLRNGPLNEAIHWLRRAA